MIPSRNKKDNTVSAREIAYLGLFTALAALMGYVEALIPLSIAVPGVKIGLCNIIIVAVLYLYDVRRAMAVSVLRVLIIAFLFGNGASLFYSLCGAFFAVCAMGLLKRTGWFSAAGVSTGGGAFHMAGQMLAACLMMRNTAILYYFPVLLAAGSLTGFLMGIAGGEIARRISLLTEEV